ncbi:ATP-binding cassette domain-containing protein [Streptomyces sp. GMY02]|uniref:ABC transporter ATP-binding protein n=1 Tax=Streptomyces sp. GMY02 TaxID=1333528 RepID=UPI001C2CA565|nr:ATP-binding cassette domain-containing protein [Streptomyces sp. GMY02]QXE38276.1 ATP-binding cassette domain-containing protein [Streptomyces sp. GMY02]
MAGTGAPPAVCADIARTYGSGSGAVVAVHGASCTVAAGARIAVVGPSGSGKSTLLHLMAGLDRPTAGRITHPGLPGGPLARHIGFVFQGPSLLPPLTVVENVALPLRIDGVEEADAEARAVSALESLGLAALAAKLPDELSAGQAQRVAVARVLARRPRLILADEPTGQLDRHSAEQVMTVLLGAAEALGAAVVVTTHDTRVAEALTTRWSMTDGRLVLPDRTGSEPREHEGDGAR